MNDIRIAVQNLYKSYYLDGVEIPVLKGLKAEFRAGEIVAIVGPSGAGKTTMLNLLGALDRPTAGEIFFKGRAYSQMNEAEFSLFRNRSIGFVFQFHHLLPEFSARENVAIPLLISGVNHNQAMQKAQELLTELGLENRAEHKPSELSGGEQQRVAVARAIINQTEIVLADEPSGNLDQKSGEVLLELLWKLSREKGHTMLIVTHNKELAEKADRIVELLDGRLLKK
jgi:lipoprotein-releasing system ATP-binding protein